MHAGGYVLNHLLSYIFPLNNILTFSNVSFYLLPEKVCEEKDVTPQLRTQRMQIIWKVKAKAHRFSSKTLLDPFLASQYQILYFFYIYWHKCIFRKKIKVVNWLFFNLPNNLLTWLYQNNVWKGIVEPFSS